MSGILDDLNPAQREAVVHAGGPLMVLAGAGSGKTRVITRRIAWLLEEGVHPGQILALTFTNKAAGEMAERVLVLGGYRVHVSTFHSACARFLRADGHHLGYPRNFSIYDTYDRDSCIKQLLRSQNITLGGAVTANKVGRRISRLKNLGIGPGEFVAGLSEVDAAVRKIYSLYLARMKEFGAMDFDDLLLRFVDLLVLHPAVAEIYQERFQHLLVDEFQDTNLVQYRLIKILAAEHRNICVVGDPDQSIYKFRGAEIRNILDFQDDYPDTATIRLETNYRSTGCILRAAQEVIEHNLGRMEKTLRTDAEFGALLTILRNDSEHEEAEEIVRCVRELIRDGVEPDEIAIFYRAHFLSRAIEQSLRQRGVPYEIVGGLSFFERREIKDVLAYLRVLVNPLDDVSMLRVVNVPPRGVGKASLEKLIDRAVDEEMSLFEAINDPSCRAVVSKKAQKGLEQLAEVFAGIDQADPPEEVMRQILTGTGYMEYACDLGDPQDITREENILELINDAAEYTADTDGGDLAGYLQHVSLLTSEDQASAEGACVSLMTVHSAKGLEFDHVFVVGLEEGVFPHSRSLQNPEDMEEERRLMYVAITRARQTVSLSYTGFRMVAGNTQRQDMSRFLREIPDECASRHGLSWDGFQAATGRAPGADSVYEGEGGGVGIDPDVDGDYNYENDYAELTVGAKVIHPVYGHGDVLQVQGEGVKMKVVVRFKNGRDKTLIPEFARLQIVPGGEAW